MTRLMSKQSTFKILYTLTVGTVLLLSIIAIAISKPQLRAFQAEREKDQQELPPLYLPELRFIRPVSFGFENFFSDILWFNTLNYFGKQFQQGRDYKWLGHNCELVTSLDYRAKHAIEFCATMLSWSARDPERSNALLERAIKYNSDKWRYRYLRAFNYWYFLERRDLAREDLMQAANLPDAPPFLATIASRMLATDEDPNLAIGFLTNMIKTTNDKNAKNALEDKLKLAIISRDIASINKAVSFYEEKNGHSPDSLEELINKGIITSLPLSPYGDKYIWNREKQIVTTASGKVGLVYRGKTAKTGIYAQEH
ncbi:MAG: hypothetical protein IT292_03345 [Deltaproteobacteria bacterium]|nr:hypothetical protein [Deltaproteobacteria bacterium]